MPQALPVLDHTPAGFYDEYVVRRRPVVLRGGARHWPAVGKWSPSFLKDNLADRVMPARPEIDLGAFSLRQFLDRLEHPAGSTEEMPYLRNVWLHHELPELSPDVGRLEWTLPNWIEKEPFASMIRAGCPQWLNWCELFVSRLRVRFPYVHVDRHMTHAWCAQIHGSKRYWIWPPRPGFKFVACLGKDLETLLDGEPLVGVLEAGDALFIPADWPHTAESVTTSISTSGNFVNESNWLEFSRALCETDLLQALRGA